MYSSLNFGAVNALFISGLNEVLKRGYMLCEAEKETIRAKGAAKKSGLTGTEISKAVFNEKKKEKEASEYVESAGLYFFSKWTGCETDTITFLKNNIDLFSRNIGILIGDPKKLKKRTQEKFDTWSKTINKIQPTNTFFELALLIKEGLLASGCLEEKDGFLHLVSFEIK